MIRDLVQVTSSLVARQVFLGAVRNRVWSLYNGGVQGLFSCHLRMCLVEAIDEGVYFSIHKPKIIQGNNQSALNLVTNMYVTLESNKL